MSLGFSNNKFQSQKRIPGLGFLKNFFKVHGPVVTLKGMFFYYYAQLKLRRLSLDPTRDNIVRVNDYHMLIIPTDRGISAELAMFNSHEPLSTKVLRSQLHEGMICLDIGSNIGYYALLESRIVGKEGLVICVEPSLLNFQYLKKNLEMQGQSRIRTYNIAVGDVNDQASFLNDIQSNLCRVVKENDRASMTSKYKEGEYAGSKQSQNQVTQIPMKTIDSLIEDLDIDRLDLVRMDPEGYESNIYQGMKHTIRKYKPMLFIEFHSMYLGIEGTRNLLLGLRDNDGYESLYYIQRWIDHPIIGNSKYIQKVPISELLKKLENDSLPAVFSLLLVSNKKK